MNSVCKGVVTETKLKSATIGLLYMLRQGIVVHELVVLPRLQVWRARSERNDAAAVVVFFPLACRQSIMLDGTSHARLLAQPPAGFGEPAPD
jgi:hypothetical protein